MIVTAEFIFLNVISGKEGARNNNARSRYTVGKEINDLTIDRGRKCHPSTWIASADFTTWSFCRIKPMLVRKGAQ
jgi:hypothetical protein